MKTVRLRFGSHTHPDANGEFVGRRKDAERIRRWWVDSESPERQPGDRWAEIRKLRTEETDSTHYAPAATG